MILGVLDFETTGVDPLQDRVIETGHVIYTTGQKRIIEAQSYLVASDRPIPKEVEGLTGISNAAIRKFGYDDQDSLKDLFEWLLKVEVVAGHNVNQFDWEVLKNWALRYNTVLSSPILIDTMWDLPGVQGRKLQYMAADDGFLNLMPHGALTDCLITLKLIENRMAIFDQILERARSPLVILESHQSRDNNQQAKDRKFHWNNQPGHLWWKVCKEIDVEEIAKEAPFDVSIRRDLNLRELWS